MFTLVSFLLATVHVEKFLIHLVLPTANEDKDNAQMAAGDQYSTEGPTSENEGVKIYTVRTTNYKYVIHLTRMRKI